MNKKVQGSTIPQEERKEWFCNRCKSEWTQIDVLDRWDIKLGFLCHKCNFPLTHDPENNRGGHEQSTKYHAQFRFITDILPKIDEVVIPDNKFDHAMASRLEVVRDDTNPATDTAPVDTATIKPTSVKGMKNVAPASISVTLTTSDGPTDADLAAEKASKEKIALQNAMPVHFTHSTVTGEQIKFGNQSGFSSSALENDKKNVFDDSSNANDSAEMDEYFARLKAEQAKEAEREQEEDEEDETDDEIEDDFEDIPVGSGVDSSSRDIKSASESGSGNSGALKRSISSNLSSPLTRPGTPSDERKTKKPKTEVTSIKEEELSDEDIEFEDI